ncbi:hypothetical protein CTA1_11190 [Colletotrichum tanaceti]|uniref:Uncharacterized protein n=1 Tax=Colletotrichum tanaceti TaxID=1306861 RepID=A0A4U6X0V5_9PEZI|nr:hypothetical protein CTA1_11190 [Colletotrichum tanaceti]
MDASSVITEHTEHAKPVLGPEVWRKPLWTPFRGVSSSRFTRRHRRQMAPFPQISPFPRTRD